MKNNINGRTSNNGKNSNRFIPNSLKFISSCIKTASSGVRSASATVAASISGDNQDLKDKVLWSSFDRLEVGSSLVKQVLLIGYYNGFQVIDVEDASDVSEVVSKRDDPVTFLQIQPFPIKTEDCEGFIASHPILLVVACDESKSPDLMHGGREGLVRDGHSELHTSNESISPTVVRFYSLKSHIYVHNLRFRSTVYMVRCSPRIVAVGLAAQIHCFDAVTLENKLSVLTYPVPQLGTPVYNVGYGPMAVGSRWLAYTCNSPLQSNTGRLSPQSLTPSPGVSPSTSPGNGSLVARYAMESSKQLATGLLSLGDKGYRTFSKYYQDFVPDAGSPVSPNSVWKGGRGASHLAENDVAGMVVVKDFLSRSVIAQFKAHTSPISALCFDPSGTLLVTASVYGNNINVFRIMPSYSQNGSINRSYDWTSSHVNLYKLHRGMTSAVIQDICFSHCSRWIGVTSSRGTCHIFAFSPFGGENILQIQNSDVVEPTISPVQPLPWWFTPYFAEKHFISSPPPPPSVTLSVASRIKSNSLGWLNSVGTASSSVSGKASIPSGAVAAVFHSCVRHDMEPAHLKGVTGLEHLLVYTSSGHVVQYKLLSAIRGEPNEPSSRNLQGSSGKMQDEDLGVRVEAVQWWDVCRRVDWPERNECILGIKEAAESGVDVSDCADESFVHKDVKSHEKSHLFLSNAEVHVSSGRIPVWLNSKMHFYTMNPLPVDKLNVLEDQSGIESEVEKLPVSEVEIRQKDLLPVLDHYHQVQSGWNNRGFIGERHSIASSGSHIERGKLYPGHVFQSNTPSAGSIVNSDGGSPMSCYKPMQQPWNVNNSAEKYNLIDKLPGALTSGLLAEGRNIRKDGKLSNSSGTSDVSNISSNRSDLSMNVTDEGPVNESPEFEQYFQEEYCKASSPLSEYQGSTGAVTDADNNIDKSVEEDDNYEMLGGVFDFSEEG